MTSQIAPSKPFKWVVFGVAFALILTTIGVISRLKVTLGEPGVKVGAVRIFDDAGEIAGEESVLLPEKILNATSKVGVVSTNEVKGLPRDTIFGRRHYHFPDDDYEKTVSVVLMQKDRTSIHQPQFCLTGQGWNIDKTEKVQVKMDRPVPYSLPVLKLTASHRFADQQGQPYTLHGIYVYWFVTKDKLATDKGERMWSMFDTRLKKGVLERWAYISCFSACLPGKEDETFQRITEVIQASVPEFQISHGQAPASMAANP